MPFQMQYSATPLFSLNVALPSVNSAKAVLSNLSFSAALLIIIFCATLPFGRRFQIHPVQTCPFSDVHFPKLSLFKFPARTCRFYDLSVSELSFSVYSFQNCPFTVFPIPNYPF